MAVDRWLHEAEASAEKGYLSLKRAIALAEAEVPKEPELPEVFRVLGHAPHQGNPSYAHLIAAGQPATGEYYVQSARYYEGKNFLTRLRNLRGRLESMERELADLRERAERLGCS